MTAADPSRIYTAGGLDDAAGDVESAVAASAARQGELATQTYPQGSVIGAVVPLLPVPEAGGKHTAGPDGGGYAA